MRLLALAALAAIAAVPAADAVTPKPKTVRIATVAEPNEGNYSIFMFTLSSKSKTKLTAPKLVLIGKAPANTTAYTALRAVKGKKNTYLGAAVIFHKRPASRSLARRAGGTFTLGARSTMPWTPSGRLTWGNLLGREYETLPPACDGGTLDALEVFARLLAGQPLPGTPKETVSHAFDIGCGKRPAGDALAFANSFGGFYCQADMTRFGGGGIEGIFKAKCSRSFTVFGVYTPETITARLDPSGFNCTITSREGGMNNYHWCRGGPATSVEGNLRWNSLPKEGEFYAGNSDAEAEKIVFGMKLQF